jgi:hypothetical protein
MSDPKRIFVSHSAKDDSTAVAFLNQILEIIRSAKDAEGNPAFLALVDRDLTGGDQWRPVLYNWMLLCDAAIILLDPSSTSSRWVPREAMVFRWRQQVDPGFRVIPVLRDVTKDIFDDPAFREMGLGELNYENAADTAGIVAALDVVKPSCDKRLGELANSLAVAEPDRFLPARPLLGLDVHRFLTAFRPERAVAASLLGYGFRQGPFPPSNQYHPAAQALSQFDWLDKAKVQKIFGLLCPYWVDRAAAANLYRALRVGTVIALRLNLTHYDWPARAVNAYIRQACSQGPNYRLEHIEAVTRTVGLKGELTYARQCARNVLWTMVTHRHDIENYDQGRVDNALKNRTGSVFLWASDEDHIKLEHLIQIQSEMPYLRIIYLCATEAYRSLPGVYYVVPELDPDVERDASSDLDSAISYFPEAYELYQVV